MAELLYTYLKRDAILLMSVFFSIALIPIPADYIGWALQCAFMKGYISIAKLILQHRNNISADNVDIYYENDESEERRRRRC
jgi:hypothetical protein